MSRHTHAYKVINQVGEKNMHFVQTRLGHNNIRTTLKHYTSKPLKYYEEIAKRLENVAEFDVEEK